MNECGEAAKYDGKKIGQRIKACRVLTGLNQDEFCRKHEIALQSLKTWELGIVPRSEGCTKLIESFVKEGIFTNRDWLLFGIGTGPSFNVQDLHEHKHFDDIIEHFITSCRKNNGNPITVEIEDNDMGPLFSRGDLVLGSLVAADSIDDHATDLLLVKLSSGKYAPRWIHVHDGSIFTRSNVSQRLEFIPSPVVAKIIWHRRV